MLIIYRLKKYCPLENALVFVQDINFIAINARCGVIQYCHCVLSVRLEAGNFLGVAIA